MHILSIFAIAEDPAELEGFDACDFYEKAESYGAAYAENMNPDASLEEITGLIDRMKQAGFIQTVNPDTDVCPNEDTASGRLTFVMKSGLETVKTEYFTEVMNKAKNTVNNADLEHLVKDNTLLYELKKILTGGNDRYCFFNAYGDSIYTFHNLLRELKPDTTYHIAQTVVALRA